MRHLFKTSVVLLLVMALTGSSAAKCKRVRPQDLEGQIQVTFPGNESASVTYFRQNNCDWAGNDQFNGVDGVVFDVASMARTKGSLTGTGSGTTTVNVALDGVFLDASCAPVGTEILQATDGAAYSLKIPKAAKWLAVGTNSEVYVSGGFTVDLHSDGKVCKKKKKNRNKKKKKKK